MGELIVKIVTPENVAYDATCLQVDIPGAEGIIGVLPGHMSLISSLKVGFVIVIEKNDKEIIKFIISNGFAQISADKCIILVEKCVKISDIDVDLFRSKLEKTEQDLENASGEAEKKALANDIEFFKECLEFARIEHSHGINVSK